MSSSTSDLLPALARCVGAANLLVAPDDVAPYVEDWRAAFRGAALAVACPGSTEEVAGVVQACREAATPIVPQGGNTGMCGGAIPDASGRAVVVAMRRMHRVLDVDAVNDAMTVEAGCVLQRVQEAAAAADRYFPLSLAAEGSCQIGGNLSTNAGGINVLRYGNTRDLVLGLEVVLPDGTIWNGLRALRKDNRGYDMKQIFVGAEGTLGIITRAVLKLFPKPASRVSAWLAFADPEAAVAVLEHLRARAADKLVAYELIGRACVDLVLAHVPSAREPLPQHHAWYVLLDFAGGASEQALREELEMLLAEDADHGRLTDAVIAQSLAQREDLWRLRESIPDATRVTGPALRSDIAVAVSDIPEFVSRATAAVHAAMPGVRVVCFGHVGDGNLHFNVLPAPMSAARPDWAKPLYAVLYDVVDGLRGSFSAEHGVGQAKRAELRVYKSETEIAMMQTLKQAFDPMNLMNPGKIL